MARNSVLEDRLGSPTDLRRDRPPSRDWR